MRSGGLLVLIALGLLAGCGKSGAPMAEPSSAASAPSSPAAAPTASAAPDATETAGGAPLIKAASYPPRDDCARQPGWADFRAKLDQAVARRDAEALGLLTAPDVQLDYGGGHGLADMKRRLDDPNYKLWDKIAALLPLGCGFKEGQAFLPWVFWNVPDDADPYAAMLVLGPDIPVHYKSSAASAVIGRLNWALVAQAESSGPDGAFSKVSLPGGGTGFVEAAKLRSVIDYRLIAERGKQGWRITALIAGD